MNNNLKKTLMPNQEPEVRNSNFQEVALGYDLESALLEADRCINCKNAKCIEGCPVNVDIPNFINEIKKNDFKKAYEIITSTNAFPQICGRVCPQENQCEKNCVRGIKGESVAIGRLERFVGDWHSQNGKAQSKEPNRSDKVAIIGSGPAGLSCANDLASAGFKVTVFEVLHQLGGVLSYGIPEFRLPKAIVSNEIDQLKLKGVEFKKNTLVGRTVTIKELLEDGYKAIFIGSGAGLPKFMNIKGENLNGVYSANEFLTRVNLMRANMDEYDTPVYIGQKVVVVGGGNVAMDAARVAKRLGSDVTIVYRRSMDEIPARKEEVEHAIEEGVVFELLQNPMEIYGDEKHAVSGIKIDVMALSEPDASGRKKPVSTGKTKDLVCDCVIMAIGTSPNPLISNTTAGLETTSWGGIVVDEKTAATSIENIYAGGDAVSGAATVILAMGAGKQAAKSIIEKLSK